MGDPTMSRRPPEPIQPPHLAEWELALAELRGASSEVRAQFLDAYISEMLDDNESPAETARKAAAARRLISQ
jgi:hypothetical protein